MNQKIVRRLNSKNTRLLKQKRALRKRVLVRFLLSVSAVAVLVFILIFSSKNITQANESSSYVAKTKYYKTIDINAGDSLWTIANEYKSGEYRSVTDLINEIKLINNLTNEKIIAGEKLIVPYFE